MKPDVKWLRENYNLYNKKYFFDKLPNIEIKPSTKMKSSWGYASYYAHWDSYLKKVIADNLTITINVRYDIEEKWLRNTLLHEMIHIYEYVTHFNNVFYKYDSTKKKVVSLRYNAHGEFFLKEAARINRDGWNIQQYLTEEEEEIVNAHYKGQSALLLLVPLNYKWNNRKREFVESEDLQWCILKTDEKNLSKTIKSVVDGNKKFTAEYKLKKDLVKDISCNIIYKTSASEIVQMRNSLSGMRGFYEDDKGMHEFLEEYKCEKKV